MSVWVELRCSRQTTGRCDSSHWGDAGVLVSETQQSMRSAMRVLLARATERGWKKVDGRLVCKHCLEQTP